LQGLFELEIPEVFERLVEIKKILRAPGYKSKVAVVSHDLNIDPVGTCVGVGGVRIKPILKELGGEKIDVIAWNDSPEALVRGALKPAEINRVELAENGTDAYVWLDDEQRSLAIGKMGQNISLASRLTGLNLHLMQQVQASKDVALGVQEDSSIIESQQESGDPE
jgi:N utilization substance protein A